MKKVFIAGAAGGLGSTIANFLSAAGYPLTCLIRPEDNDAVLEVSREQIVRGYIEQPGAVYDALADADVAVNCAALLPNVRHLGYQAFRQVNVDGAINLLKQCQKRGTKHAILFSTISVVDHLNRHITSDQLGELAPDKDDPYQLSKVEMERAVLEMAPSFPGSISVLRPAFVYGPGNYSVWADAFKLLKASKMVLLDNGKAFFPLVFSEDVARFIRHLIEAELAPGSAHRFVLTSPQQTHMREVFDYLAELLGAPHPRTMPSKLAAMIAAIVGVLPHSLRKGRLRLLTKARVLQYSKGYDLSGVSTSPPLGFVFNTDFRSGFREMLGK